MSELTRNVCAPARAIRCLVLVGQAQRPETLLKGLCRRKVRTTIVPDAPAVMVALAHHPSSALIVNEPSTVHRFSELLAAVERYYPTIVCWQYTSDNGGKARLTKLLTSFPSGRPPLNEQEQGAAPPHRREPRLRAGDEGMLPTTSPLVTHEELAMLIGLESPADGP